MAEEHANEQTPDTCTHDCGTCSASCGERTAPPKPQPNSVSTVKHAIGIVSGKGGVGKTLVTCLIASELTKAGKKVAILDADATGPSIPKAFGLTGPLTASNTGINPAETESGIKVMSTNLMVPKDDQAIAWRGPMITSMITQFFSDVNWGEIDYMLVDMPPGTSDVLLTVLQQLPIDGIVTVSAPQELVAMIVGKAVNLAHSMDINVLGLVENMAYYECPDCGKRLHIFGEPQGKEIAERYNIPAYATLPIDSNFARLVDAGRIEEYDLKGALDTVIETL